jgi:tetratricopeptide (TPR) repeat protein
MSLLLDALKKAEQAKREKSVAEGGAQAPRPSAPPDQPVELRLEPLPADVLRAPAAPGGRPEAPSRAPGPEEITVQGLQPGPEAPGSSTLRLDLPDDTEAGKQAGPGELDLEEFQRRLAESAPPAFDTGTLGAADLREGSTTSAHTMPSLKNVQAALKEFYGTGPAAPPSVPASAPGAPEPGPTAADTQASRKAARNVFTAKERPARGRRSSWQVLGASAIVLALLVVGGYYAALSLITVQPSTLAISRPAPLPAPEPGAPGATPAPSAPVASVPPAGPAAAPEVQAPAAPATPVAATPPSPATSPAAAPGPQAPGEAPVTVAAVAPPAAGGVAAPPTAPASQPPTAAPSTPPAVAPPPAGIAPAGPVPGAAPSVPPAAAAGPAAPRAPIPSPEEAAYLLATRAAPPAPAAPAPRAAAPAQPVAAVRQPAAPAAPQPAPAAPVAKAPPAAPAPEALPEEPPVRVARPARDPVYTRLDRAYRAFQAGSYAQARGLYQEVLRVQPANRDALLGLGAVSVALGEIGQAQTAYQRVIAQNPQDQVATAALSTFSAGGGGPQGEARLKAILQRDPGASYAYFGLGNLYAAQRRWPEAQQAYFEALRTDSRNADYAFNLAVSLEHLGQRRAALDHYRRAVELAGRRPASFSQAAARERIALLETVEGSGSP